jgi:hypothetical protein
VSGDDDTAGMSNQERAAWLVNALREDADQAEVDRIIAAVTDMLGRDSGMKRASVIVACAKMLANMMEDAPDGQELEAYVSVHGMVDYFLTDDAAETMPQ